MVAAAGEGIGRDAHAGAIHRFRTDTDSKVIIPGGQMFHQDTAGVPDAAEPGDGFGLGVDA